MDDREFNKQRRRIRALIRKWVKPLGLGWWTVNFEFSREPIASNNAGESVAANCHALWPYKTALIKFYMPDLSDLSDEDLERVFVHELMHIFLAEAREDDLHHEERVASDLANAFLWIRGLK